MKQHKKIFIWLIIFVLACMIALGICGISAKAYDEEPLWTNRMIVLHEAADILRDAGYSDDSPVIQAIKDEWNREYYDLCLIARVIEGEAGGCPHDHQVAVGAVLWNRVNHERFPNTVYECVVQPGQYTYEYTYGFDQIRESCWIAAIDVLNGNHDIPWYVIWQAEFPQGSGTWWISEVNTGYYHSTTYFCYGVYGGSL